MATTKICGIETEYGILVRGADISPMTASSLIVNAYNDQGLSLRAWDFSDERPDMDARTGWNPTADYPEVEMLMANSVLTNGSRFYVDHAHPEISTPECRSISDVVLYDLASEVIMRRALERANQRLPDGVSIGLYKNNSDGKGNSYGCHENYLVDRAVPFGRLASAITAHFVTRQIFCGSGKVGVENRREGEDDVVYQVSQRADFFEETVGLETTVRRPIVNTRDEPHCDPARWRRLHVIVGDANMSDRATFLKLGTTALVLCMIEDDAFPMDLVVEDPVTEMRRVSHDVELAHHVSLADGSKRRALEMQWTLHEAATRWHANNDLDHLGGDTDLVLEQWGHTLAALDAGTDSLVGVVDWITKGHLIDAMRRRHGLSHDDPRLKTIDLQYHDIDPARGLFQKLARGAMFDRAEVERAVTDPPIDTRAYFRGSCLRTWPDRIQSANWDSIVFDTGEPALQRVPMMDPTKGTKELVGHLFDRPGDVAGFLDSLGGDVEDVIVDPGW